MLHWNSLKSSLKGESILDSLNLDLKTESEAYQFLLTYGFDWYVDSHRNKLTGLYREACRFIETMVGGNIPAALNFETETPPLLRILSDPDRQELGGSYASVLCAILRVMHVLVHIRSDLRLRYLPKIRRQTVGRIESHLHRDGDQLYLGFESDKVRLHSFEVKDRKMELSVVVKLLAKAEAMAHDISDYLGVRMVTETKSETIWALNYLFRHHLVSSANLMSARLRNTVMNFEVFEATAKKLDLPSSRAWTEQEHASFDQQIAEEGSEIQDGGNPENPFSSSDYHALQLTSRPLIRIPSLRKGKQSEITFFFPLEIQLMDRRSYEKAMSGEANHELYKRKQLEAAKRRIFGPAVPQFMVQS